LPNTGKDGAAFTADKLRTLVETNLAEINKSKDIGKITITAGVSTYPDDGNTVDEVISKADKFLYLGKVRGRNMVVNSTPVDSTPADKTPVDTNIVSENSLLQDIAQH